MNKNRALWLLFKKQGRRTGGYTLVELVVAIGLFAIVSVASVSFITNTMGSLALAKQRTVGLTLATNQMEYLRSLPYDSLAVVGGSIYSPAPLASSVTKTVDTVTYTVKTSINYVDDAYDNCGSYPTGALKLQYCRNSVAGTAQTDNNPKDYKVAHVSVVNDRGQEVAQTDTSISARVAESASSTGALFVTVIDGNGNPVSGATVAVTNTVVTPNINASATSDNNGIVVFYDFPPDASGKNYIITAQKSGYSSLGTIGASGSKQPTYPNQQIFTQQSSAVTMVINPQASMSLVLETVNTSGSSLGSVKVNMKGGYKKYSDTSDTSYYYDTLSPSDIRPVTDGSGFASLQNLAPGPYYFCGDGGSSGCVIGETTYYLAAVVPYSGVNLLSPAAISANDGSVLATPQYSYGGNQYIQKVRLILTTSSSFPRVQSLSPAAISKATDLTAVNVQITGANLPCSSDPASCGSSVTFSQGTTNYAASCTGDGSGTSLSCTVDLSAASAGSTDVTIATGGGSLHLSGNGMMGSINVTP